MAAAPKIRILVPKLMAAGQATDRVCPIVPRGLPPTNWIRGQVADPRLHTKQITEAGLKPDLQPVISGPAGAALGVETPLLGQTGGQEKGPGRRQALS